LIKRIKQNSNTILLAVIVSALATSLGACGFTKYVAKTIDPAVNVARFESKDPAGEAFHQYLLSSGYTESQLPLQQWGIEELTYCALFFHPSLDVARAQWRAAEAAVNTAGVRPIPNFNSEASRSSAEQDSSPYAFEFSIDVQIETANKRNIRIENASHLSEAAKLEIAQMAWGLRNQVALSLNEYQFNLQLSQVLQSETLQREEIVNIFQKRLGLGEASNVELSTANLLLQAARLELITRQQNQSVLISKLAGNLGLSLAKTAAIPLFNEPLNSAAQAQAWDQNVTADIQATAVFNRLDIRIALERYAAAEARLKLEIAKQYPNIIISPGYAYAPGDRTWSLGLSGLLTLLQKNRIPIAEATQLREVEAAQFDALQTRVMTEASIANAELLQAKKLLDYQANVMAQQQQNTTLVAQRFAAGEVDRLTLALAKLENYVAEKNVVMANYQLKIALTKLENTLQRPLTTSAKSINVEDLSFKNSANE
jgi:outer membrane protein TolC